MAPFIQCTAEPDVVDLGWGHPAPWALPGAEWAAAVGQAVARYGWKALTYGYAAGPEPFIGWLCDRLSVVDRRRPAPGEVFATAGTSHALELVCSLLLRPGDTVLVEPWTYHLALRIFADHGVRVLAVPADDDGVRPEETARFIESLRAAGVRVPLLYLVPTYANPTGRSLPADRRAAVVRHLAGEVTVVEDDTYREISFGGAPPSLWSLDGRVVRISSFSKSVAPGLRLGYITAAVEFVDRLVDRGMVDSGGCVNHTNALAMAEFGDSGAYERHIAAIRAGYAAQRDALVNRLRDALPDAGVDAPDGGWFLWMRLPAAYAPERFLAVAQDEGVAFLPGSLFSPTREPSRYVRLSYSMYDPERLEAGASRLVRAWHRRDR